MWFGGDWPGYMETRIRVYVDGEPTASIDMELGLGHGIGFGDAAAPWGCARLGKTGHPSGIYNTYRIPFGSSMRVTAQRSKSSPDGAPFWWIVRGTENLPVSLGGVQLPPQARLRLHKLELFTAQPLEEFALCDLDRRRGAVPGDDRGQDQAGPGGLEGPELPGSLYACVSRRRCGTRRCCRPGSKTISWARTISTAADTRPTSPA